MLTPNKYMKLNNSIIYVSSLILQELLNKDRVIEYNSLYNKIKNYIGDNVEYLFIPSLNFLYLMDKINYNKSNDNLELII